jgi:F-type H+-transporting ATPase subunit epsilon
MATQKLLKLTISQVDAPVFDGEVLSVTLPGTEGEMTILADHEAMISVLKQGMITVKMENGEVMTQEVSSGTLEMSNNHATILI